MHKFLKLAKSFIEDHHYNDNNAENFRLAAIIVRGGNVVSVGSIVAISMALLSITRILLRIVLAFV